MFDPLLVECADLVADVAQCVHIDVDMRCGDTGKQRFGADQVRDDVLDRPPGKVGGGEPRIALDPGQQCVEDLELFEEQRPDDVDGEFAGAGTVGRGCHWFSSVERRSRPARIAAAVDSGWRGLRRRTPMPGGSGHRSIVE